MLHLPSMLALGLPDAAQEHLGLIVAVLVCVVGLLVIGLRDVARFSIKRAAAIASVVFTQAMRRRVLWITPLVMLAVILVSQLGRPIDPQDDVRQTAKFCLFAAGMMVALLTIILACTNLPKEIETRVIYTIATKPASRMEIVAGKIVGFAQVSAAILLVLGAFSLGWLHLRDWTLRRQIDRQLSGDVTDSARPALEYYRTRGLLHAREYAKPLAEDLQFYSELPEGEKPRWVQGASDGEIRIPFEVMSSRLPREEAEQRVEGPTLETGWRVSVTATTRPAVMVRKGATTHPSQTGLALSVRNTADDVVISSAETGAGPESGIAIGEGGLVQTLLPTKGLARLRPADLEDVPVRFWLTMMETDGFDLSVDPRRVQIDPGDGGGPLRPVGEPSYHGRTGRPGELLNGSSAGAPVAVYRFRNAPIPADATGSLSMQWRCIIQREGDDREQESDVTRVTVRLKNLDSGKTAEVKFFPESSHTMYFAVPAEAVAGGNFEAAVQCHTDARVLALTSGADSALQLVSGSESFAWNLLKSLTVLWMMSVLIIIISVFCSTFVSWPIAVVLTMVVLGSRWCFTQLGDVTGQAGMGRTVVTDLFQGAGASQAQVISESVEGLTKTVRLASQVLPDLSQFQAIEALSEGAALPGSVLWESLKVLLGFGLPLAVLTYIFLKHKEVAP